MGFEKTLKSKPKYQNYAKNRNKSMKLVWSFQYFHRFKMKRKTRQTDEKEINIPEV